MVALLEVAVHVRTLVADRAEAGAKRQDGLKDLGVSQVIELVPKAKGATGLTGWSRRGVVERPLAWRGRGRRLAKDGERTVARSLAWVE